MAPRRRCPVCRSKQWHKEPSSGLIACSEGHVLQNYRNEDAETDEMGPHTMRKRALKSRRKKKEKGSKADPKLYHGPRARYHYFQCLQLLLRQQISALTTLWKLPPEFEIVCRDIWALHLSLLPDPPPPEPFLHLHETRTETQTKVKEQHLPTVSEEADEADESSDSSDSAGEEDDSEMAELMQENSASDSSSDEDVDGPLDPDSSNRAATAETPKKNTRDRLRQYDSPANNIAVLVLACWTMRLPIIYADFRNVVESYELPYLDPVPLLPTALTLHLTRHTIKMLSPHHAPKTMIIHKLASRLAKKIYSVHGIRTPEINAAPVLWRVVRSMGGNPNLYTMTKRLAHILSLPLTLHYSLAPNLKRERKRDPESHKFDNVPPELALIATCIVVLKMVYGLDNEDKPRLPKEMSDPACALPRLQEYLAWLRRLDGFKAESQDAKFSSESHMSVGDLGTHEIDDYLNLCEKALARPANWNTAERAILEEYFPLTRGIVDRRQVPRAQTPERPKLPGNSLNEDSNEDALLPGELYTLYNPRDAIGYLPENYETVVNRAAMWVAVPEAYLSGVVEKYERRVMRWWDVERRRQQEALKEEEEERKND